MLKKRLLLVLFALISVLLVACAPEEVSAPKGASAPEVVSAPEEAPAEEPEPIVVEDAEDKELSFEEKVWRERIEKAMAPSECPDTSKPEYPASYYQGPLIDTHLHIPAIPDWSAEEEEEREDEEPEGRFGGPQALLGWNVKMSEIACTLKHEGTTKNFAFFPVYEHIPEELLEIAHQTMERYPELFTPFIMSSGNDDEVDGYPTVDAATLAEMLDIYPGLFHGYGEIGLYERENGARALPPDAAYFNGIYPLVKNNKLLVYFHPGEGQLNNFKNVLKQHPDIIFIVHGDEIEEDILDLMDKYLNIYYTNDPSYSQHFPLFVGKSKEKFLTAVERDFDSLIAKDIKRWKNMIEEHPDRFMWGIDRGDASWNYDADVGLFLVKYARAFIGKLDPKVQEKFAYQNAEKLLERR